MVRASTTPPHAASPLQEAQQHELARFGGKGAADAGQDVHDKPAQDDRSSAEPVARRPIEDLAGAEGDHEGRQGELDVAHRSVQVDGDHRQRRQVHVDRAA
jgi:hypothetical protein